MDRVNPQAAPVEEEECQRFQDVLVLDGPTPIFVAKNDSLVECVVHLHPTDAEAKGARGRVFYFD